jgi:hypothetical protein
MDFVGVAENAAGNVVDAEGVLVVPCGSRLRDALDGQLSGA